MFIHFKDSKIYSQNLPHRNIFFFLGLILSLARSAARGVYCHVAGVNTRPMRAWAGDQCFLIVYQCENAVRPRPGGRSGPPPSLITPLYTVHTRVSRVAVDQYK